MRISPVRKRTDYVQRPDAPQPGDRVEVVDTILARFGNIPLTRRAGKQSVPKKRTRQEALTEEALNIVFDLCEKQFQEEWKAEKSRFVGTKGRQYVGTIALNRAKQES